MVEPQTAAQSWLGLLSPAYLLATLPLSLGVVLFAFSTFLVSVALPCVM